MFVVTILELIKLNWKTKSLMLIIAMLMVFSLPVKSSHPVLQESSVRSDIHADKDSLENELSPSSSLDYDHDALDAVFSEKLTQYGEHGRFDQIYQPCIMSTYHAVYTLYTIGKLSTISKNDTIDFIMRYYNESTGLFMDEYALRFLDMDYYDYYPLSTLLEVNCYAMLILDIYGELERINPTKTLNFIWSCYYQGGFLGKPYDPDLSDLEIEYFLSLDNLYFAVQTLDVLLGSDWSAHQIQRTEICDYIRSRQYSDRAIHNHKKRLYQIQTCQIFS